MAPPQNINPAFLKGFVKYNATMTDPQTGKQRTYTEYRPKPGTGYDILTDDALNSGNLKVLTDFSKAHEKELEDPKNAPAKEYIDARIQTAKRFQDRRRKAKLDAAMKKTPPKLAVDNTDGFVGFSNLKYTDYQTSSHGCWSIAYSTLLRSRGVDISQEEIRRWRPDYPEDIEPERKANPERKRLMNSDSGNSIFPNSDLLAEVVPNTAMNQLRIEPFSPAQLELNGKPLNSKQEQIVRDEYKAQVKRNLQKTIMEAIREHRSPVALSWDGHFVTITGISPDGQTLRYEESLGAKAKAKRTRQMSIDDLITQGLEEHDNHGRHYKYGFGLELNWLSDIPVAEHGSGEKQPPIDISGNDYVKVNEDGSVSVDIPKDAEGISKSGSPIEGQLHGTNVEQLMNLDRTELTKKLGGEVTGWSTGGGVMIGMKSICYPDRIMRPGDPALMKDAFEGLNEKFNDIKSGISYIITNKDMGELDEMFGEAEEAAELLEKAANGEVGDIDEARGKIANLIDSLAQKQDNGKSCFENLLYTMNDSTRRKFVDGLSSADQMLGLGKGDKVEMFEDLHAEMEAGYQKKQAEDTAEAKVQYEITHSWNMAREYMTGSVDKTEENVIMTDSLARMVATCALYEKNVEDGRIPPYPTEQEIQDKIPSIKSKQAFVELTTGAQPWKYDPKFGPNDFIREYAERERRVQAEKKETARYAISPERLPYVKDAAAVIADRLDATKTGSYTGLGVISRHKNSGKFENAKTAIRNLSTKQEPSAREIKSAADTVMSYLRGKETVRKREFGRQRWQDCMSFLAKVMPRDKFESYCGKVNEQRHAAPGHADYVSPESFYPAGATLRDAEEETKERILRGESTTRDFARLLACDRMRAEQGASGGPIGCGTPEEKRRLCGETETVLADPRFKDFVGNMTPEERQNIAQDGPELLKSVWESYKETNPLKAEGAEKDEMLPQSVSAPQS